MELLTVHDVAEILKISPVTVRRFITAGKQPAVRVGRGVRVRKAALDQVARPVESRSPTAKSTPPAGRPMTADDPLSKLVGSVTDAPPTDSSRKYEYLAATNGPQAPWE
jgi:excisionase family DNA binding protein